MQTLELLNPSHSVPHSSMNGMGTICFSIFAPKFYPYMYNHLQNLKVIELASVLAGPSVGQFFAELGAKVIKVENKKTKGDVTRQWKLANEPKDADYSAYYCSVNWNKEVIFADLSDPQDQKHIYELSKDADIIIANFKTGADVKLKMDYETFRQIKPSIIYGKITGFGDTSKRVAFDVVLQAETGFMYMNGTPQSGPVKMPVALMDLLAAHQLKEGILVALLNRTKTGEGAMVSASLFDAAIASLANQASNYLMANHVPQPMGTLHPNIAPYGEMFATKDHKQIVLAIGNDKQFVAMCQVLGNSELSQDERFVNNLARVANRQILAEVLAPLIQNFERDDLLGKFVQNFVPAGAIRNMQEVFELPRSQELILTEQKADNRTAKCVRTCVFEITQYKQS